MNLAVVFGGTSREKEVSIGTGKAVLDALKNQNNVYPIDFKGNYNILLEQIRSKNIDLVFNALHGGDGEDGTFQLFLEQNNICYTGSDSKSSKTAMNKDLTKKMCLKNNIPTPKWDCFHLDDISKIDFNKLSDQFSDACVIKPSREGSSIGMHILKSNQEKVDEFKIKNAIKEVLQISNKVIIEEYIQGRELTVGVLDEEALPVVEIFPKGYFYDYSSKYTKGECDYLIPAKLDKSDEMQVKKYALQLHKLVGCHSYSRVDFLMDIKSNIFALEINALPGLTNTSLLPKATMGVGMSYLDTIQKIIELSSKKK